MILTSKQFSQAANIPFRRADSWVRHLNKYMAFYGIDGREEVASFIAQVGHESQGFARVEENLNYSVEGLANTWPSRFRGSDYKPNELARKLGRIKGVQRANKRGIANITYGNRMGNGYAESGDGWNYRGRGLIMLTGKNNYERFEDDTEVPVLAKPNLLLEPENAMRVAAWFWRINHLDKVDDDLSQLAETRIINGGLIGIRDRERRFSIAHSALREVYV